MHIAVFGAGGKSGVIFVKAALDVGHTVTANVHHGNPFAKHPRLIIVFGDARNANSVNEALKSADTVVSLVGHRRKTTQNMQTDIIKNIIAEMKLRKIKRIISLTGTGVRLSGDRITLADQIINRTLMRIDPARINDGRQHVEVLRASKLDWTVIRVLKLQNNPARPYTLKENGPTKLITSRHEVASAILDLLDSNQFIGKAPIISN